jgi:Ca2+:H+ antiporter
MPSSESSPLLPNSGGRHHGPKTFDPIGSSRYLIFGSWLNIMLVAVPLSFVADLLHWPAVARFSVSFIAIVPLAKLLGDATEQVAIPLGQTVGGLLNAT